MKGGGSPRFGVLKLESQGEPHAGFWPARPYYPQCPGRVASSGGEDPDIEVARRRDALARWRNAMAQGLTSEQAARAVGSPRSTLYRWQKRALPLSRRPRRLRQPRRPQGSSDAVERLRLDHPMWGKESSARSCANRATLHPTPPSGASSARSSGAERFSPLPP